MATKETKVITKRRKFQSVEIPLINTKMELVGESIEDLKNKTIKLDLTRQLKGKGVEAIVKIRIENGKAIAEPKKMTLMSYFIRRMIRKRISYVENSFETPSQESMVQIKPFLITRKKVSRAVRKALRNRCQNWIEDYIAERKNNEIFNDILSNRMQRSLSLILKKTYPLSLCEIRVLDIKRDLSPGEVPKIKERKTEEKPRKQEKIEEGLDQFAEIEEERKKKAEEEIKKAQEKAIEVEEKEESEELEITKEIKPKKERKKKESKEE